jgi:sulfatase modifying factor 1
VDPRPVLKMSPGHRRSIRNAAVGAAWFFAAGSTGACSTVLGIGDRTNLTDGGEPDALTGDGGRSTAEGGPDATMPKSGTESGTDATIEAGECTAPETKCVDGGVETCTASGTYGAAVPCASSTCAMGMCTGSCEAGVSQCSGNSAEQICVSGTWGTPVTCTNQACVGTVCAGVCSPSATRCTSDTQVETCGSDGQWGAATTCTDACVGTIGALGGTCGGVCVPNATRCSGNAVETCGANGQWGGAVACSGNTSTFCANGACTSPPSCQTPGAGLTTCGATSESCCTSLEVAGGTYYRTYDPWAGGTDGGVIYAIVTADGGPTGEADPATVSGLRLDKYLVTVGRFRQFVDAWNGGAGYIPPPGSGKHTHLNGGSGLNAIGGGHEPGWVASDDSNISPINANLACDPNFATWTNTPGSRENLPINCVTWWESYAFCIWDGGFLPSESEWGYAAGAGSQQREYPWGTTAPGTACPGTGCAYAIYNCDYPSGSGNCTNVSNIAPVGTATQGAGLWGQLDLAGEVQLWNLDGYHSVPYVDPCIDCAEFPSGAGDHVVRGGAFDFAAVSVLSADRSVDPSGFRVDYIGLRCARTP